MGKIFFKHQILYSYFIFITFVVLTSIQCRNFTNSALIIVDVQNDFCSGGPLAVPHGDDVIPVINRLRSAIQFGKTVFTLDYHPPNHVSFHERFAENSLVDDAGENPESKPMSKTNRMPKLYDEHIFDLSDGMGCRKQKLWPVHCVQNTTGAELRIGLARKEDDIMIYKGTHPDLDSYSGFMDNDHRTETELDSILKSHEITELFVSGLALEFCVGNTALDGVIKGYRVSVVRDATGSFGYGLEMENKLRQAGVQLISSEELIRESHLPQDMVSTSGCQCQSCNCPSCSCFKNNNIDPLGANGENLCNCPSCTCPACTCRSQRVYLEANK